MEKKIYEKPMIKIERFTLSQSIARNCGSGALGGSSFGRPMLQDIDTCTYEVDTSDYGGESISLFVGDICSGEVDIDPEILEDPGALDAFLAEMFGEYFGEFCYNNPNEGVSIFGSA